MVAAGVYELPLAPRCMVARQVSTRMRTGAGRGLQRDLRLPWWIDFGKDTMLILLAAMACYLLFALLSAPQVEAIERQKRQVAEQQIVVLSTRIAQYPTPTARPCRFYPPYDC